MKDIGRSMEALQVRRRPRVLGAVLLGVGVLSLCALILTGWHMLERESAVYEEKIAAAEADRRLASSRANAAEPEVLTESALLQLSNQVELINRDWSRLLESLVPDAGDVRLLAVDVDPFSGLVRVSGASANAEEANAYSALVAARTVVQDVRLLSLERNGSRIVFEVTARWLD